MKTRIRSFFMAMLLVLSLTVTTLAAGTDSAASLDLTADRQSDRLTISVCLSAENATNGRIVVEYDADTLALVDHSAVDAGLTSVNTEKNGEVSFAWVGSNITDSVEVLTLVFQNKNNEDPIGTFTGTVVELYSNGIDLLGDEGLVDTLEVKTLVPGDLDDDGKLEIRDVIDLLKALASKETDKFDWQQATAADVNGDGKINTRDAIAALQAIAAYNPAAAK
ncbi:MAG: dockerin type I repeat-containing protein [Oscillospiraceae bacterium]|nr:dockerin type I repeat-containing protein [Oscillospiraceae bacterium]